MIVVVYSPAGTVSFQVILPLEETAKPVFAGAIEYVTVLFVAFCGATVAVNCLLPAVPATALEVLGDTVTPVAGTVTSPLVEFYQMQHL
ncbi:TPA: hypothetical protein IXU02_002370 [Enterococcus faecium]|uniref:hypothetical protein n=1 Tax=Enterococcus TaxID=1350 RepID=UPI001025B6FA|nr:MULTISPECIES: hypothetical protein [Enterococcus]MBT9710800.1 hypothetical protein [Enterococcus faecium]NTL38690.1 hypothetical protein [Enterococcus faecium]NTL79547.1 hypothetical protein [Enterococcus faecium]VFA46580.1 Uncharacterised protein [Enterococcus faecium]HAQ5055403.1 hypothetical protein [Enterococcus faecium]